MSFRRRALTAILLTATLAVPACADVSSQEGAHTESALGFAPPIAMGDTVTGQIASPQLDVWALKLQGGDKIRLTKTVTSGDLKPDVVLFRGTSSSHTSSSGYDVNETSLTKDYELSHAGTYYVVVRGYQNQGSGSYSLSATCLGGPCAGEVPPPPVVELDDDEKHECIQQARKCAIDALPAYNGAVGAVRAQQIFDKCLGDATVETWSSDVPATCAPACQGDIAGPICDSIVGRLPWLADQTTACVATFNEWVDACYDAGYGQENNLEYGGEDICVGGEPAFNGTAADVRDLQVCGGEWAEDSCEGCFMQCWASTGAWIDDLDTICSDECDCDVSPDFW